jgi:hypothetical protein
MAKQIELLFGSEWQPKSYHLSSSPIVEAAERFQNLSKLKEFAMSRETLVR